MKRVEISIMVIMALGLFLSNAVELNAIVLTSSSVDCTQKTEAKLCQAYYYSCNWIPGDGCVSILHANSVWNDSLANTFVKLTSCDYIGTCQNDKSSIIELSLIVFFCFFFVPFLSAMFAMSNAPKHCYSQPVNMFWTRYKETFFTGSARERINRLLYISFGFSEIMEVFFIYRHYRLSKATINFNCSAFLEETECKDTEFDLCSWNSIDSTDSFCEQHRVNNQTLSDMLPAHYTSLVLATFITTLVVAVGSLVVLFFYAFQDMIKAILDSQNYYRLLVKPGFGCINRCDNICSPPQHPPILTSTTSREEEPIIESVVPFEDMNFGADASLPVSVDQESIVEDAPIYERKDSESDDPAVSGAKAKAARSRFKSVSRHDTEEETRQRIHHSGCDHWPRCCQIFCTPETNKVIREHQLTFAEDINQTNLYNPASLAYDKSFWRFFSLNALFRIYMGCCFIALHGSHITARYNQRVQMLKYIYPQQLVYLREIVFGLCASLPSLVLIIIWEEKLKYFAHDANDQLRGITLLYLNTLLAARFLYYLYELALIRFGCHEDEHNAAVIPLFQPEPIKYNVNVPPRLQDTGLLNTRMDSNGSHPTHSVHSLTKPLLDGDYI